MTFTPGKRSQRAWASGYLSKGSFRASHVNLRRVRRSFRISLDSLRVEFL